MLATVASSWLSSVYRPAGSRSVNDGASFTAITTTSCMGHGPIFI